MRNVRVGSWFINNTEMSEKKQDRIAALIATLIFAIIIGGVWNYYYALNDDIMIKDILAGVYTGTPEGRNMQMLYPLGWILSMLYRMSPLLPWYGVFLAACQLFCFYKIGRSCLPYARGWVGKIVILLVEFTAITALFLEQQLFLHYTLTCGLLGATALFCFYMQETDLTYREFLKENICIFAMILIGFALRTEMFLLLFPLLCLTAFIKWGEEEEIFTKENLVKYFGFFLAIVLGGVMLYGGHLLAVRGEQWSTFERFFQARTDIYDFYGIPPYEEHQDFYESIGMTKEQQALLVNYNYALDDSLDTTKMEAIAAYAKQIKQAQTSMTQRAKESLWVYCYGEVMQRDIPWPMLILLSYVVLAITALCYRRFHYLWKIPLLLLLRSGLWLFLIYRDRIPPRIAIPLYVAEFLLIVAMLFREFQRKKEKTSVTTYITTMRLSDKEEMVKKRRIVKVCTGLACMLFLTYIILMIPTTVEQVNKRSLAQEEKNQEYLGLQEFCIRNKESFYWFDVYSMVDYTERAFAPLKTGALRGVNYDFLGGWAVKSPLQKEKLAIYGIESIDQSLRELDQVYVISAPDREITWLEEYYVSLEYEEKVEEVLHLEREGNTTFRIYQLR